MAWFGKRRFRVGSMVIIKDSEARFYGEKHRNKSLRIIESIRSPLDGAPMYYLEGLIDPILGHYMCVNDEDLEKAK